MITHLLLLILYGIALTGGVCSMLVFFLIFLNKKNRVFLFFVLVTCFITLFVFNSFIEALSLMYGFNNSLGLRWAVRVVFCLSASAIYLAGPIFLYLLSERPVHRVYRLIYYVQAAAVLILIVLPLFFRGNPEQKYFFFKQSMDLVWIPCLAWNLFFYIYKMVRDYPQITSPVKKSVLKLLIPGCCISFPLLFLDCFNPFFWKYHLLPVGFKFQILFLVAWNTGSLYFISKHVLHKITEIPPKIEISLDFIETFMITQREKEIIDKVIQNSSYREIGNSLFISPRTVNNHMTNIYKKLSVNNRSELIRLINEKN